MRSPKDFVKVRLKPRNFDSLWDNASYKRYTITNAVPFRISVLAYQELMQGTRSKKEREMIKKYFGAEEVLYLPTDMDFFDQAAEYYRILRSQGITIRSTIDLLIAMQAVRHGMELLHNDRDFDKMAGVVEGLVMAD